MRLLKAILAAALIAVVALGGCRAGSDDPEGADAKQTPPEMAVTAARASVAPMRNELRLLGVTAARRHIQLRAPVAGRVTEFNLNSGDRVRRGQVVAHIINRESEAAQAGLETAKRLDPEHAASLQKSVRRYTGGSGIAVVAPENAIVAQRLAAAGQMVAELDPLADLIDPGSIFVEAAIPIDSIHFIKPGMEAIVTSQVRPGVEFRARVAALAPSFDANSATTAARLEFASADKIEEAGAAVEVRVVTESAPEAIVIPPAALFQDAERGGFYVYVAGPDGLAHRTIVTVGIRNADLVQITGGLVPGQMAITSGGYALSDGLRVHAMVAQK